MTGYPEQQVAKRITYEECMLYFNISVNMILLTKINFLTETNYVLPSIS